MDNKITLVTAFFDIGREKFKFIPRDKEKYFEYFKRWARMQNELVFVCENQVFADRVLEIRDEFNLKDKTHVILIDNIENIEPELLFELKKVESSQEFKNFRIEEATENNAMYNYVVFLKFYCLKIAKEKGYIKTKYCSWIDFGFEHGGEVFEDENDYNFEWEFDFGDKINLFRLPYEEKRPIFEVCRTIHPDSMTAGTFVVPNKKIDFFYDEIKKLYFNLAELGLMDDDQLYLLWFSRKFQNDVKVNVISYWFMQLNEYSNHKFKMKQPKKRTFWQKVKSKLKRIFKK